MTTIHAPVGFVVIHSDGRWELSESAAADVGVQVAELSAAGFVEIYRFGLDVGDSLHYEWLISNDEVIGLGLTCIGGATTWKKLTTFEWFHVVDDWSLCAYFQNGLDQIVHDVFPSLIGPDRILLGPQGEFASWLQLNGLTTAQRGMLQHLTLRLR